MKTTALTLYLDVTAVIVAAIGLALTVLGADYLLGLAVGILALAMLAAGEVVLRRARARAQEA